MLRLLAQREQGYDDIAALMGLSVGEVRAKVVGALAQLEAEGEPRPDVPPPFPVAGEEGAPSVKAPAPTPAEPPAEPKPRAPEDAPAPTPVPNAEPAEPSRRSKEAPPAKAKPSTPKPASAGTTSAGASPSGGSSGGGRTVTIPSGRGLWPWIGGAVAIIAVVVIVILIAGGGGGSSSSSTEAAATSPSAAEEAETGTGEETETASNPATSKEATAAVLKPVDGSSASGKATFGRIKNKLALLVEAEGLETTSKGDAYTVWLAQSENKMLPLASSAIAAKSEGKIAAQFEVKTEILAYLANGTFDQIYVTRTQDAQLKASVQEAVKKGAAPAYTGETVLKGTVTGPIVGAALREEEAQEAKEKGE
jgi:flagellar basal body-associated protein FliL